MNKIKKKRLIRTIKYKKDTDKRNKNDKGRVMCSVLAFSAITIQLKLNGEKR